MNSIERYKKRKNILKDKNCVSLKPVNFDIVNQLVSSKVDMNLINNITKTMEEHYHFEDYFTVTKEEAKEFLEQFKKDFNQARFDKLIIDCKKDVINSIVTPFGLGKIVAAYDKAGGNVTTIHNANNKKFTDSDGKKYTNGVYAKEEDKYNRKEYTNTKNSNGQQFAGDGKNSVGSNFTKSKMDESGNVTDVYTGKIEPAHTTSPDHIESLSQHHKNGGFMQNSTKKADFATDTENLALTNRPTNQSMRDFDKNEWKEKETATGIKNKDKFQIDEEKLEAEIKKGKKATEKHLPTNTEKSQYYVKNSAITGLNEGSKMGMQQAIGLVMTEFFTALFDEILDIYKNGFSAGFDDDKFLTILKKRLQTIARKIKAKWKDVAIAFKDGFISGFISNLVTTAINMFVTTAKRVIRIIREGIYSLIKAVKLLIFPPENMTYEEAMHEAKKIIASGLIVTLGVIAEEYIEKFLAATGALAPFASTLTAIFVGAITGLAITMTVYYLDKRKNDKDAINALMTQAENSIANGEALLAKLNPGYA
ncbi:MAG: lactate permease [Epsilonproteobacteria bacterium]|nr:lactate permease [Campylobacterota bacterium]